MIYLDYQATTPLAPEAREAMLRWLGGPESDGFGNPHSAHRMGRAAKAAIEVARDRVEAAIGLGGGSLSFTGSATEAINWAIKGTVELAQGRNRIVTVATEHAAVLDSCDWIAGQGIEVIRLPVGSNGLLEPAVLDAALDERVALVAAPAEIERGLIAIRDTLGPSNFEERVG